MEKTIVELEELDAAVVFREDGSTEVFIPGAEDEEQEASNSAMLAVIVAVMLDDDEMFETATAKFHAVHEMVEEDAGVED